MGKIEWSMWANEQAIASAAVVVLGGIIAVAGQFTNGHFIAFGSFAIVAGVIILLLEYPRSKRQNGKCLERKFQRPFTRVVKLGGLVTRNYFIRFVFYLLLCVPCFFILPTLIGGMCLFLTSVIYFVAAIKGEEWRPVLEDYKPSQGPTVIQPPSHPPPRLPEAQTTPRA